MGGMKIIFSLVLGFALWVSPVVAREPVFRLFAECAGRASAEMEHGWLMGRADAAIHQAQREEFITLLGATQTKEQARAALNYRIEVKLAHSALLTLATFGTDKARSARARRQARAYVQACQNMLLGS